MSNVVPINESAALPSSVEAEREFLAAVLVSPYVIREAINTGVKESDFYLERHRILWAAFVGLYKSHGLVDEVLVVQALTDSGKLERFGGAPEFSRLLDRAGTTAHIGHYARIVREKSELRRLAALGQDVTTAAVSMHAEAGEVYALAERKLAHIRDDVPQPGETLAADGMDDALSPDVRPLTIATGIAALDRSIGGIPRGEPTVIGGRPGMGKSSMALGIVAHGILQDVPRRQVVFTLEMNRRKVLRILTAQVAGIEVSALIWSINARSPERTPLWPRIKEARERIDNAPLWVVHGGRPTADDIVRVCHATAAKHGPLDLVVIDYWQRMRHTLIGGDRRDISEAESSARLCQMAMDLDCGLLELTQLLKASHNTRPTQADIRECDALNADAGAVLFPWRPNRPKTGERSHGPEKAEIVIEKCRDGEEGAVEVEWRGGERRYV